MKRLIVPFLVMIFASAVSAQSDLPDVGKLADLKGMTKVYIVADAANLKQVLKAFKNQKNLVRVDKTDDAEFFIEYKELRQDQVTSLQMTQVSGEMSVYFYRGKRKVIAWSESKVSALAWPSLSLTKRFLKEFDQK